MPRRIARLLLVSAIATTFAVPATAADHRDSSFKRIATLPNYANNDNIGDETVSEIVAATDDGMTLVYTDGELDQLGFVDITDPENPMHPVPTGKFDLPGEPTSVAVLGNQYALASVNTSASLTDTSGVLVVVDISDLNNVFEVARHDLSGQPDAIAISPDGQYAAVAIENERDEELCVGGALSGSPVPEDGPVDPGDITKDECEAGGGAVGVLPQTAGGPTDTNDNLNNPPGALDVVDLSDVDPVNWIVSTVDLTGLADYAPGDPEPEFVDINDLNEVVVTLQENNHIAIVDLATLTVIGDFPLGTVDLVGIDATEDDIISLSESLNDVPREPDAVAWVGNRIATANEGDLFGGSRGFSIFNRNGRVVFDTGNRYEKLAVQHGHYPEGRSENKGSEPEAIEYGRFNGTDHLFVGSERGSFVAVYRLAGRGAPRFEQLLPGPLGPEGLLAIPERNLLVVSGEEDDPDFGVRSSIMIYGYGPGAPTYPQIVANSGNPTPFSALSGMDALPNGDVLAVWDSFYADSRVFRIDPDRTPALVKGSTEIVGGTGNYDPEGIAIAPDRTWWIASEGNRTGTRLNRLLQVSRNGVVLQEIGLPAEIEACRAAEYALEDNDGNKIGSIASLGAGFEGVAVYPDGDGYKLLLAQQRGWNYTTMGCQDLDDDPNDVDTSEPTQTRIWIYDPSTGVWDHRPWELAPVPMNASWTGLSEITQTDDGDYVLIERDNRTGDFAQLKTLVKVSGDDLLDGGITAAEKSVVDIIPDLEETNGWITDKPEGTAITRDGRVLLVTDNDGVDDWSGETWFLDLGELEDLFEETED
jgi:hypothetical protein